jgi:hypothetical protein
VTESVAASLEGRRLGSFTRVSSAVQSAVEEALTRILTPNRSIDILREVKEAQVSWWAGWEPRGLGAGELKLLCACTASAAAPTATDAIPGGTT